jgi:hypothetical protein
VRDDQSETLIGPEGDPRESSLAGSSGTKARGEAEREREKTEAAPRGGMRWGLSGRKPSAVNI